MSESISGVTDDASNATVQSDEGFVGSQDITEELFASCQNNDENNNQPSLLDCSFSGFWAQLSANNNLEPISLKTCSFEIGLLI